MITCDLSHPVWFSLPGRGRMEDECGGKCAIRKFVSACGLDHLTINPGPIANYFDALFELRQYMATWKVISTNDHRNKHYSALREGLMLLSFSGRCKFVGDITFGEMISKLDEAISTYEQ